MAALPNDGPPLANQVRQGVPDAPLAAIDRPRAQLFCLDLVPVAEANARALARREIYFRRGVDDYSRPIPTPPALRPYLRPDRPGEQYDDLLSATIDHYAEYKLPLPRAVLARELLDRLPEPGFLTSDRAAELLLAIWPPHACRNCGGAFLTASRRVAHCSEECRRAFGAEKSRRWHAEHRTPADQPPARSGTPGPERRCALPGCGQPMPRKNRTYCSRACQEAAFRAQITAILRVHRGRKAAAS